MSTTSAPIKLCTYIASSAGAVGSGAVYTRHVEAIQILRRVILRINTKLDFLILKLH